jgi:apolipoprotein N-acyltransferase
MTEPLRRDTTRAPAFLLAALGGVCCFLGFVGFGVWPLSLVCFVPLWHALEEVKTEGIRTGAMLGFTFGFVAYLGGFHWMWCIVDVFLDGNVLLGGLFGLLDASWFALRFALYAAAYASVRRRGWSVAIAAVPPLLVIEWLHPLLFPVFLGHALARHITMIQISDVGGPLLLTALLALVNVAVFETWRWRRRQRRRPQWTWALTALGVFIVWSYGTMRIRQIDALVAATPTLRVGMVQGNLGVFEKGDDAAIDHREYLEQTRELLTDRPVDLVVWPETVYTRGLRRPLPLSGDMIRADIDVPLLFGAATVSGESGRKLNYNSALLIGADGVMRSVYDKNVLIPFTEYVPFADSLAAVAERFGNASEFTAGSDAAPLQLGDWRIATPICHEVVQASYMRRMVAHGSPHLIATLANDSWFGDTQEPWLHLEMARMRAVEHRRYLVRATNSGVSAVIDPIGREVARSHLLARENLYATVGLLQSPTIYTAWGDWPGWVGAFIMISAIAARQRNA